ncbi:DUF1707 domain-containing protein [Promicromonospora kroppenstedtii]|uniref:DUF1707 domain-containing protein n=1 Tax=Promicromonospora kroppenstedtii TaxID=440482 RepID=A0ABW7XDA0_9MICO
MKAADRRRPEGDATMMWDWGGFGWGWGLLMMAFMAVFWLVVIGAVVAGLVALLRGPGRREGPGEREDAERILADRFASGQIDGQEYHERLDTLRAARRPGATGGSPSPR